MPMKEKTMDQLLRETWLSVAKYYNDVAADYGGTMTIGFTLLNIDPVNGTPSTALAKKMGLESTGLTRTLKKMQEKGLIYRDPCYKDKRSILIKLTDYGHSMREKAKETVLDLNERIREKLTPAQRDCFVEVLETILQLTQRKTPKSQ